MTLVWLLMMITCVIIEASTVSLVSIWFAVGSLIAMIAASLEFSLTNQLLIFLVVSIISVAVTRPLSKKYLKTKTVHTNLDRIISKHALVTSTITADKRGEVSVMAMMWSAKSFDNSTINEGEYCQILAIEGSHVVVKKI